MKTILHLFVLLLMINEQNCEVEKAKLITTLISDYRGALEEFELIDPGIVENLIIRRSNITSSESLEMPNLSYLTIESSRWDQFGNLIGNCCQNLVKLELQLNELITRDHMKAIGSLPIESLWISETTIPSMKGGILRNKNLKDLILIYDRIKCIDDDAFTQLPELEKLFLCGNHLTSIPKKALAPLKNLKALAVLDNEIEELHASDFEYLPNLKILQISRNPLKKIDLTGIEKRAPNLGSVFISSEENVSIKHPPSVEIITNGSVTFYELLSL